ncbi:hypothetical protein SD81_025245 [Tolypothrix campylonemoides VB511288]|nr:hypothetical protein SD81_025245 [Tolypothrix campylonemoides VB511288]
MKIFKYSGFWLSGIHQEIKTTDGLLRALRSQHCSRSVARSATDGEASAGDWRWGSPRCKPYAFGTAAPNGHATRWHKPPQDLREASPKEIATAVQMDTDKYSSNS